MRTYIDSCTYNGSYLFGIIFVLPLQRNIIGIHICVCVCVYYNYTDRFIERGGGPPIVFEKNIITFSASPPVTRSPECSTGSVRYIIVLVDISKFTTHTYVDYYVYTGGV